MDYSSYLYMRRRYRYYRHMSSRLQDLMLWSLEPLKRRPEQSYKQLIQVS